jgi:hypothetical protein
MAAELNDTGIQRHWNRRPGTCFPSPQQLATDLVRMQTVTPFVEERGYPELLVIVFITLTIVFVWKMSNAIATSLGKKKILNARRRQRI